jgi:hypothetical protein
MNRLVLSTYLVEMPVPANLIVPLAISNWYTIGHWEDDIKFTKVKFTIHMLTVAADKYFI